MAFLVVIFAFIFASDATMVVPAHDKTLETLVFRLGETVDRLSDCEAAQRQEKVRERRVTEASISMKPDVAR